MTELRQELGQLQQEHGQCQKRSEELLAGLEAEAVEHAKTKERLSQAEADAVERRMVQEESRGYQERCQQAEARLAEAGSQAEKSVLQQLLAKAEAERSEMLGQLLDLREERGMHKERIRELERQLFQAKRQEAPQFGGVPSGHPTLARQSGGRESDLAEQLGYSLVHDIDDDASSILSGSSQWSVKQHCFMSDAIFKTRSCVKCKVLCTFRNACVFDRCSSRGAPFSLWHAVQKLRFRYGKEVSERGRALLST